MFLTRSIKQKIAATCGAVFGFILFYEVTMLDSRVTAAKEAEIRETTARPAPGLRLRFTSTAYCKGTTTASGTAVQTGIAAADPELLPVGSVIQIDSLGTRYNGIYTIMDTGPAVQGRHIDLYMWSCNEALAFGRKPMALNVLRLGWNPRASSPGAIRSQFNQREQEQKANADAQSNKVSDATGAEVPPVAAPPATVPAATSPVVKSSGAAGAPVQQASVASRQ
jgi:3D (Asp-Asp-Asp) domain-containing protein